MRSSARGSWPRNKRTAAFRGERQGLRAPRPRSRVRWPAVLKPPRNIQTRVGVTPAMRAGASLAFARTRFHFDCDHGLIVECVHAGSVLGHGLENFVDYAIGRLGRAAGDDRCHPLRPKRLTVPVARVENAVTVEHEQIAGLGLETEFVVIGFVEQSQRKPGSLVKLNLAFLTITEPWPARVRHQQRRALASSHS